MLKQAKQWARSIKNDVRALYIAGRDSRTPWYVKALCVAVVAYALSPVDLIPDFIPVFGYVDDLIIVPLGILLAVRLIPAPLMAEYRAMASSSERPPAHWLATATIVAVWIVAAAAAAWWAYSYFL